MPELLRRCLLLLAALVSACTPFAGGAPSVVSVTRSAAATLTPSPIASQVPTQTPESTPSPTLAPDILELTATSCEGGVVLRWSATAHPDFHHYTALRSPQGEIVPDYPPIAPAVDWGDSYATDPFVTSAVDATIIPSETEWHYRVMAYDADNRVLAASPVRSARLLQPVDLGDLRVELATDGSTRLRWEPYAGDPTCFSSYRILSGTGARWTLLTVVSGQDAHTYETDALHAGTTYQLRVEAVRDTTLGGFVLGQTETATFTVP